MALKRRISPAVMAKMSPRAPPFKRLSVHGPYSAAFTVLGVTRGNKNPWGFNAEGHRDTENSEKSNNGHEMPCPYKEKAASSCRTPKTTRRAS